MYKKLVWTSWLYVVSYRSGIANVHETKQEHDISKSVNNVPEKEAKQRFLLGTDICSVSHDT